MRANKVMNYESILQVLQESGCPFCRFMKDYQASLLQELGSKDIHHLCNFHTWGLAASQRASSAADLFLGLLHKQSAPASGDPCDICTLLQEEEDLRIREFISCLRNKRVAQWLRSQAVLCMIHGAKLKRDVPPVIASMIGAILENYRTQLVKDLTRLGDVPQPDAARWGLLGHAAEFLASQRGLHA
jgi:hypothetical protein